MVGNIERPLFQNLWIGPWRELWKQTKRKTYQPAKNEIGHISKVLDNIRQIRQILDKINIAIKSQLKLNHRKKDKRSYRLVC